MAGGVITMKMLLKDFPVALLVREGSRAALGRRPSKTAFRVLRTPRLLHAPRGPEWLEQVG